MNANVYEDDHPHSMEVKKHEKPGSLSPVKPVLKKDSDEGKSSRSSSKSDKELRLPPEKSPSDDGSVKDRRRFSKASESSKDTFERQDSKSASLTSPKVSRKYFTNWKQACDKTKDKTKELLKRWRTLPEGEAADEQMQEPGSSEDKKNHGWSVHVWIPRQRLHNISKMSKETKAKDKEKVKNSQNNDTKKESKRSLSDETASKRRTRMSNVKEEGFYNFNNMMVRNVKSQAEPVRGKVGKRAKKRVKTKGARK